jgi:hypothetical protein
MLSHNVVWSRMCSLLVPKSVFFPCPSPFRRPNLKFFPFRLVNRSLLALVRLCVLVFLKYLTREKPQPQAPHFSPRMSARLLCFSHRALCFPQPTTSRPSPCSLRPQPWTPGATFMAVYFRLEMQATGGFSFQRWRSHVEFRSVACGYSESQNCTKYSEGKIPKSRNKHEP